jgi:chemotaxis protein CheD
VNPAPETMVRMGEIAVSRSPGDVLVAIGLGSCIGLALVDQEKSVAGLAHVMLPESNAGSDEKSMKFADRAVPALRDKVVALGASPSRLEAVLVGGAQMFALNGGGLLDIGARNEAATLDHLSRLRIPVRAKATSGNKGRTVRVFVERCRVVFKEAGGTEVSLLGAKS